MNKNIKNNLFKRLGVIGALALGAGLTSVISDCEDEDFPQGYSLTEYRNGEVSLTEYEAYSVTLGGKTYSPINTRKNLVDSNGDGLVDIITEWDYKNPTRDLTFHRDLPMSTELVFSYASSDFKIIKRKDEPNNPKFLEADELLKEMRGRAKNLPPGESYFNWKHWGVTASEF